VVWLVGIPSHAPSKGAKEKKLMSEFTKSLRHVVSLLQEKEIAVTLFGIGPMSEVVIRATLELGRDMDFPVMFIASRNQIDSAEFGGGYVMGWDQRDFSDAIRNIAQEIGFEGSLYLCRDHGGPWQRDKEKYDKLSPEEAMRIAKASYLADLEAGFNLLHIDPTKDPHSSDTVPMDTVIERTLELMEFTEEHVQRLSLSNVSYEVGTEETAGGLITPDAFQQFIEKLLAELDNRGFPHPAFIVGQTGTLVKMNRNVGNFDAEAAQKLCHIAKQYGLGFKEHNADYLPPDILKMHPDIGITGANVAPEFGLDETTALVNLAGQEEKAIGKSSYLSPSNFISTIQNAALECGRWKKWLTKEEAHLTEKDISANPRKLKEVMTVCGHYVFNRSDVQIARAKLYENLKALEITDSPERWVIDAVKKSIKKYVDAFNLKGLDSQLH
jgi:tagatose-1,6-bisphosphate aldolase non-catalytic subunit AgaZ/GatZ